jgi:hypothetical protein
MTQDGDREPFLERWSRRKLEQVDMRAEEAALPAQSDQKDEPAVALPPIESLNSESDFTPFMNPKVDGVTRRAALKKLFTDAHYNIPDPFEAYSEDYTVSEAIPLEMLKTLNHAQKLLFDEPEKKIEAAAAATPLDEEGPKDAVGKQDA